MPVLTEPVKIAIVQALACYDTPTQVAELVKQEYGVEILRNQVGQYDPTKAGGKNMGRKLRDIFDATRAAFLQDVGEIPIAKQSYRLRVLNRLLVKVEGQGNTAVAAQLLEQAAKEVGGSFTNKRELTGKDGKPLMPSTAAELTDEQLAAIAAGRGG
jgi:hypothetical protein